MDILSKYFTLYIFYLVAIIIRGQLCGRPLWLLLYKKSCICCPPCDFNNFGPTLPQESEIPQESHVPDIHPIETTSGPHPHSIRSNHFNT